MTNVFERNSPVCLMTNMPRNSDRIENTLSDNDKTAMQGETTSRNEISEAGPSSIPEVVSEDSTLSFNKNECHTEDSSISSSASNFLYSIAGPSSSSINPKQYEENQFNTSTSSYLDHNIIKDRPYSKKKRKVKQALRSAPDLVSESMGASSCFGDKKLNLRKTSKTLDNFATSEDSNTMKSSILSMLSTPPRFKSKSLSLKRRDVSSEEDLSSSSATDEEDTDPNSPKHLRQAIRDMVKQGREKIRNEMGKATTYHDYCRIYPERRNRKIILFPEAESLLHHEDDDLHDSEGRRKINLSDGCDFQRFVVEQLPNIPSDDEYFQTPLYVSTDLNLKSDETEKKKTSNQKNVNYEESVNPKGKKRTSQSNERDVSAEKTKVLKKPLISKQMRNEKNSKISICTLLQSSPERQRNSVTRKGSLSLTASIKGNKSQHVKQAPQANKSVCNSLSLRKKNSEQLIKSNFTRKSKSTLKSVPSSKNKVVNRVEKSRIKGKEPIKSSKAAKSNITPEKKNSRTTKSKDSLKPNKIFGRKTISPSKSKESIKSSKDVKKRVIIKKVSIKSSKGAKNKIQSGKRNSESKVSIKSKTVVKKVICTKKANKNGRNIKTCRTTEKKK